MVDTPSIPRQQGPPDENSFERLREDGIELIQELSGRIWTDYNVHDPGVTILEQLCYALTDAIYQADFDAKDHLTGPDGLIDFDRQALYRPEKVFPCRPTTLRDYRTAIRAAVPEVENVWLVPISPIPKSDDIQLATEVAEVRLLEAPRIPTGLYEITISPPDSEADPAAPDLMAVKSAVSAEYHKNRNLCEDLAGPVCVAEVVHYSLRGKIEIVGARPPEDILAEIYDVAATYVASGERPIRIAELLAEGVTLEEVLSGPFTARNWRERAEYDAEADPVYDPHKVFVADIDSLIQAVSGVAGIRDLYVAAETAMVATREKPQGEEGAAPKRYSWLPRLDEDGTGGKKVPRLRVPADDPGILLTKADRTIEVAPYWHTEYLERRSARQARRSAALNLETLYETPRGRHRELPRYHSVQNHFPAMYGVNEWGVPASSDLKRKAQAKQLKGYLLSSEQFLANFNANVRHLRDLFSTVKLSSEDDTRRTYRYQVLDDSSARGVEELYWTRPPDRRLRRDLDRFDDYLDRKSRLLDHMLAMFGETFSQRSLQRFDPDSSEDGTREAIVRNKIRLLGSVVEAGRDRAGGDDLSRSVPSDVSGKSSGEPAADTDPVSGFGRRLGLLLGLEHWHSTDLATREGTGKDAEGFHVLEHILLRPADGRMDYLGSTDRSSADLWRKFYPFRMSIFFPGWTDRACQEQESTGISAPGIVPNENFRLLVEEIVLANCPAHIQATSYWLDRDDMLDFEELFRRWRGLRYGGERAPEAQDSAAVALIGFIEEMAAKRNA